MSLALAHKKRVLAQQAAQQNKTAPVQPQSSSEKRSVPADFNELKAKLDPDLMTMQRLNGDEEKHPFKKDLIEKYRPLCEHLIANYDNWARLDVLFWWLMWRNDLNGFDSVQADWYQAIEHGLTTPNNFKRDWQTVYLDEMFKYSDTAFKAEEDFNQAFITGALSELELGQLVTNTAVKSKLFKLLGQIQQKAGNDQLALDAYKKASSMDPKVGVKTVIKELAKKVQANVEK